MVKFADGGNKKKMPYANLQWLGREQDAFSINPFEHITLSPNGLVPAIMTHPGGIPRYALAAAPVGGYQLPSGPHGWLQYSTPYIMHAPLATMVPASGLQQQNMEQSVMPQIVSQMSHMQLSAPSYISSPLGGTAYMHLPYPPPSMLPQLQSVTAIQEPRMIVTSAGDCSHHVQSYTSQPSLN